MLLTLTLSSHWSFLDLTRPLTNFLPASCCLIYICIRPLLPPFSTRLELYVLDGLKPTLTDVGLITCEADLPEDLYKPGLKLFVCSTDLALQRKVVDACDTLTTSLGPVRIYVLVQYNTCTVQHINTKYTIHRIYVLVQYNISIQYKGNIQGLTQRTPGPTNRAWQYRRTIGK